MADVRSSVRVHYRLLKPQVNRTLLISRLLADTRNHKELQSGYIEIATIRAQIKGRWYMLNPLSGAAAWA